MLKNMSAAEGLELETIYVYRIVDSPADQGESTLSTMRQGNKIIRIILMKILVTDVSTTNDALSGAEQ